MYLCSPRKPWPMRISSQGFSLTGTTREGVRSCLRMMREMLNLHIFKRTSAVRPPSLETPDNLRWRMLTTSHRTTTITLLNGHAYSKSTRLLQRDRHDARFILKMQLRPPYIDVCSLVAISLRPGPRAVELARRTQPPSVRRFCGLPAFALCGRH
ncbi:hypothetical protein PsYK624_007220 [Phanerochaete sordida]|uniref:Uncharacterized protein n=1 Tax=Phanerochaete sordida TaxID=48140 RepID=A0A9P3FY15_9APHY|nr:hypothetical protein PsYK624_007220 [Phanerochaete sordida]